VRATPNAFVIALTALVIATAPRAELLETLEGDVRGLTPPASLAEPGAPAASFLLMSGASHRDLRDAPGALLIFTDGGVLIAIADDDARRFAPWRRDPESGRPLHADAPDGSRCATGTESNCWRPGDPVPYSPDVAGALGMSLPLHWNSPPVPTLSTDFLTGTPLPLIPLNGDPGDILPRTSNFFGSPAALTDQQEAMLGCGALWGTDCDVVGVDLRNAEASVLMQSYVGSGGSYSPDYFPQSFENWQYGNGLAQPGTQNFQGAPVASGVPLQGGGYGNGAGQVFQSEMAALSFNMQNLLVAFSVPSDAAVATGQIGRTELDAADPFSRAPGQCSFAQPMYCANNRTFFSLSALWSDGSRRWLWEDGAEYRVVDAFGDVGDYAGGVVHVLGVEESRTREASLGVPIALFPPAGRTVAANTRFAVTQAGANPFGFAYLSAPEPSDAALAIAAFATLAAIDRRPPPLGLDQRLRSQLCVHAEVIGGPDAVLLVVADDVTALDQPEPLRRRVARENVVDAALRLERRARIRIAVRPGDAVASRARDAKGVVEIDRLATERRTARQVADLVGVGLRVEIPDEHGREAVLRTSREYARSDGAHLRAARVAVVELPVEMRAAEREPAERRVDCDVQRRARLAVAAIGQLLFFAIGERPAARDGVAELELRVAALEAAGRRVVAMRQSVFEQRRDLVETRRAQCFLESDDVRSEPVEPLANPSRARGPRSLVVPEIQREDSERHGAHCSGATSARQLRLELPGG
jgi:hypothetical protein